MEKTKALNWGMAPPPSWRDPVEAEATFGLVLVGCVVSDREIPLDAVLGMLQKAWPFDAHLVVSELAKKCFSL